MSNLFKHKGYLGSVSIDHETGTFVGKVEFINDLVTFEADNYPELKKEFEISVEEYLEDCKELGRSPDKPFNGTFNIRIPSEKHKLKERL